MLTFRRVVAQITLASMPVVALMGTALPSHASAITPSSAAAKAEWLRLSPEIEECDLDAWGACGHRHSPSRGEPDGVYTVTAATIREITWWVEGGPVHGESHTITLQPQTSTTIRINELQVLVGRSPL